jgi:hypothetical protein
MWLIIYIRRGVFVARFDRSGKFEDLKAGTGNSEGSTLLVYETSVSACFPIITSGKGPKGQKKNLIMTRYKVVITSTGWFSRNVKEGMTFDVWSNSDVKPSHDEVRQAFIAEFGVEPSGSVAWEYQAY